MKKILRGLVWIALLVVVGVILLPGILPNRAPEPSGSQGRRGGGGNNADAGGAAVPVLVAKSIASDVPVYIEGVGTVKPLNSVLVRTQVDGVLIKLLFQEGQDVKAGAPLAQIDPRLYQAALDQAVAKKAQDEALPRKCAGGPRPLYQTGRDQRRHQTAGRYTEGHRRAGRSTGEIGRRPDRQRPHDLELYQYFIPDNRPPRHPQRRRRQPPPCERFDRHRHGLGDPADPVIFNVPQQQLPRINAAVAQGSLGVDAMDDEDKNPVDSGTLQVVDNTIDQTTGTVRLKAVFPNPKLSLWPAVSSMCGCGSRP